MAHNMVPSSCSSVDATCCRASCCTVNVQLGEIKDELKGLRNMVDITVRLLSKLVPDSIDDFKNILNGRTGLTITRVPTVAPSEDDNIETKIMVVEEHNTANKDSLSRCNSEPGDIEVIDPFPAASVEHASRASSRSTSPGSTYDLRRESGSSPSDSSSLSAFPKAGACYTDVVKNCEKTPVPVIGTPLESLNTLTSQLRSPPLSISVAPISEYVPKDYCKNLVPDLQEKSSSLNISHKEESDTLISRGEMHNAFPPQLSSDSYQLNRLEETSRALPILSVNSISALLEDQTIRLPPDTDVIQEGVAVKEELSSENDFSALNVPSPDNQDIDVKDELQGYLGDGVLPVCVVMKREEEDCPIINQEFTSSCDASNQNCAAMNYNGRSVDEGMLYGAHEESNYFADASVNQVDSPLKTLFGISLVSKLKQKIQEKIQAAVSTAIEDSTPVAESENDRSNLVDPGSSLNISVNLNSENNSTNSNQPTVSNNKAHPKCFQCRSCAKVFFCTIALNTHKSNCIGSRKHFRCSSCPLMFKSKAVLCNHRRIHARSKRHKCDKCGKQFTLKSSLKRHKQMHACIVASNNRYKKLPQHLCNVCGQGFLNATNLSLHQTLHVVDRIIPKKITMQDTTDKKQAAINAIKNVRRYPCGYCEEAFIDKRSVTLHEKLHTDKEFAPFEQERRRIQRRYQLMLKMQKEQQEKEKKQFGCTVCGRCYPQELLLHMHTRLHHAIS